MSHHTTIRLEDVSLTEDEKAILNNVSFHIHAGKINTVLGQSGSSKTSVLRL